MPANCSDRCHGGGCEAFGNGPTIKVADVLAEGEVDFMSAVPKKGATGPPPPVSAAKVLDAEIGKGASGGDFAFRGASPRDRQDQFTANFGGRGANADLVTFDVTLTKRAGASFGFAHTLIEDGGASMLLICELRDEGPVQKWNDECHRNGRTQNAIQRSDRIVSVAGSRDIDTMRSLLRKDEVRFAIERWPETFTVTLKKLESSDRFGMRTELARRPDRSDGSPQQALLIAQVAGGLLGQWNEKCQANRHFYAVLGPGIEIIQVGSIPGDPKAMQDELFRCSQAVLVFRRPPRLELTRVKQQMANAQTPFPDAPAAVVASDPGAE